MLDWGPKKSSLEALQNVAGLEYDIGETELYQDLERLAYVFLNILCRTRRPAFDGMAPLSLADITIVYDRYGFDAEYSYDRFLHHILLLDKHLRRRLCPPKDPIPDDN